MLATVGQLSEALQTASVSGSAPSAQLWQAVADAVAVGVRLSGV
jgi:hypothetical protein